MYVRTSEGLGQVARKCGCQNGCWKFCYDGCSIPNALINRWRATGQPFFSKDNPAGGRDTDFALRKPSWEGGRACDRHDECYQTPDSDKTVCDRQMCSEMKAICDDSLDSSKKDLCHLWANYYCTGLKVPYFAKKAFQGRQKEVGNCGRLCNQTQKGPQYPPCAALKRKNGAYLNWLDYYLSVSDPNDPLRRYPVIKDEADFQRHINSCKLRDPSRKYRCPA